MSTATEYLHRLGNDVLEDYSKNRRAMSFAEYLSLVIDSPTNHLRSAPQYAADCFRHFGTETVEYPYGTTRRFKLFDCPWADGRERLIGQEDAQNRVFRALTNFVREGTSNRLILLHGPNGSAKSTLIRCIGRAMQHYSTLDAGALYRIHWVFPTGRLGHSGIGFSRDDDGERRRDTFAYLPDESIDARLPDELRDHPILLIPVDKRQELLDQMMSARSAAAGDVADTSAGDDEFILSDYIRYGRLSHKNRAIYEALLASYRGDFTEVLRHVQVERFYIRHRYREGYVTVEPQLSVDASERQITADRSLAALPAALQSVSLFEYGGEVVNANRGLIEYSDLLKRPLEAYKYLLTTVEHASIHLPSATLYLDLVFVGTSNDIHLDAFKKTAEFLSFKGRLDLIRVPYLRDFQLEQSVYEDRIREAAGGRHIAPHCAYITALWAVLTRMRKPTTDGLDESVHTALAALSPVQKAELYSLGRAPDSLDVSVAKSLRAHIGQLLTQSEESLDYEGRIGASPREMLGVLFNAANASDYRYVSPLAILNELREFVKHKSVYRFLELPPEEGGYRAPEAFIDICLDKLIDVTDQQVSSALGLVEESEYTRIFDRYITHVTHWLTNEKMVNPMTGRPERVDENSMRTIEETLGCNDADHDDFRRDLIAKIGAWSLDHPNETPDYESIFPDHFKRLANDYFETRKNTVQQAIEHVLTELTGEHSALDDRQRKRAQATIDALVTRFGYNRESARDAVSLLYRARYHA